MTVSYACWRGLFLLVLLTGSVSDGSAGATELVTTAPLVADGVLYVASAERPGHQGHLRALDLTGAWPELLWDAAAQMPLAGVGDQPGGLIDSDPPDWPAPGNRYRSVWTNLPTASPTSLLPFTPLQAEPLQAVLAVASIAEAAALINRVRGRLATSAENPVGTGNNPARLWGISASAPALVGASPVLAAAARRDRVVYAGAEDGMLHAFWAGRSNAEEQGYQYDDPAAGSELWAYLPGSLLPYLKTQPYEDPVATAQVHVDGPPQVGEHFVDGAGHGVRNWHTLLVSSATIGTSQQSLGFALDVSNPYRPQLLWERLLPGANLGRTRGPTVGSQASGTGPQPRVYFTSSFAEPVEQAYGLHAAALDLISGSPLWQFTSGYDGAAASVESPPASPALLDVDADGWHDLLVFGDLAGRLWALDAQSGTALAGGPAYCVAAGSAEPIGAGVAVFGRLVVFGTGGAEHAEAERRYAIYAVEIDAAGQGRLVWSYRLEPGERVWAAPTFDHLGNLIIGVADLSPEQAAGGGGHGRLVVLDAAGHEQESLVTAGPVFGRVKLSDGVALAVSASGEVYQLGSARRSGQAELPTGALRLLSWRLR